MDLGNWSAANIHIKTKTVNINLKDFRIHGGWMEPLLAHKSINF